MSESKLRLIPVGGYTTKPDKPTCIQIYSGKDVKYAEIETLW